MSQKLNVDKLESYLLSITDQLKNHEDELVHPVWWNTLVRQIDQIAVLKKKQEHQNGDINSLRELVLNSAKNTNTTTNGGDGLSAIEKAKSRAMNEQVGLLEADVETLKVMVRRIDMASATESLIMSQIRELQRFLRSTTKLIDERAPDDAYLTLKEVVETVESIVPSVDQRLKDSESFLQDFVESRIPVVSNDVSLRVYKEERSKEVEFVPKKEFLSKMVNFKKMVEGLEQKVDGSIHNLAMKSTMQGKRTLQESVKRRLTQRQRTLFERWIKYTTWARRRATVESLKHFQNFWPKLKKYVERLARKLYFTKWAGRVSRLNTWDLYKIRLKKSILYWRDKACPDLKKYLIRWKSVTVTLRIPEYNPNVEEESDEEEEAAALSAPKSVKELDIEITDDQIAIVEALEHAEKEGNREERIQEMVQAKLMSLNPGASKRGRSGSPQERRASAMPSLGGGGGIGRRASAAISPSPSRRTSVANRSTSLASDVLGAPVHLLSPATRKTIRHNTAGTGGSSSSSSSAANINFNAAAGTATAADLLNMVMDDGANQMDADSLEYLAVLTVNHLDDIPLAHPEHKISLLGQYMKYSSTFIDASMTEVADIKDELDGIDKRASQKAAELKSWIDNQCGAVASNLQKSSNRFTLDIRDLGTDLQNLKDHTADEIERIDERLEKLYKAQMEQKRAHKDMQEAIDGLKLLQGDVLERTDAVEERMSKLENSYTACINNSDKAISKAVYAEDMVNKSKEQLDEGLAFFDSEFTASKKAAKLTSRLVEETASHLQSFEKEVRDHERKIQDRVDDLDDRIQKTFQAVALPDELAEICFSLEEKIMSEPGGNVADLFRDQKYNQLLSNFCLRLARQIHDAAHTTVMEKIIAGNKVKPSTSPNKTGGGTGAKIGAEFFQGDESGVELEQKALLEAFSEEFVRLLRERESRPGYVRAQTRVVLHSRFTAAIEMALGEMNSRDKKPYMHTIPSEFLDGMGVQTYAWGGEDAPHRSFPSPTRFETMLLPGPATEHEPENYYRGTGMGGSSGTIPPMSNTTGILGPRSKTAPGGIVQGGEELLGLYAREQSIPSLAQLRRPGPVPDATSMMSRKLASSGKLDAFGSNNDGSSRRPASAQEPPFSDD
jgi:hypothetical protein